MPSALEFTAEGNDASFAGNHLGHFLLKKRLMPQLTGLSRMRFGTLGD
jgi:hypothetical protein